ALEKAEKTGIIIVMLIITEIANSCNASADFIILLNQKHGNFSILIEWIFLLIYEFLLLHFKRSYPMAIAGIVLIGKLQKPLTSLFGRDKADFMYALSRLHGLIYIQQRVSVVIDNALLDTYFAKGFQQATQVIIGMCGHITGPNKRLPLRHPGRYYRIYINTGFKQALPKFETFLHLAN